jgi:hypothetical protein
VSCRRARSDQTPGDSTTGAELTSSVSPPFILQVELTADDYRQYFAIVGKRQSTWTNAIVNLVAIFAAVPVALAFRFLASLETTNRDAIDLVGLCSLFAYVAGLVASILAGSIIRRISIAEALTGTPNAYARKTIVIDNDAVSMTGALSDVRWTWPAFTQFVVPVDRYAGCRDRSRACLRDRSGTEERGDLHRTEDRRGEAHGLTRSCIPSRSRPLLLHSRIRLTWITTSLTLVA